MNAIGFGPITAPSLIPQPQGNPAEKRQRSFAETFKEAVQQVSELRAEADRELRRLLSGEPVELHRVLLAEEKADLASQLMMSVRNKVVDAYQEIMRMQV